MLAKKRGWFEKRGEGRRSENRYQALLDEIKAREIRKSAKDIVPPGVRTTQPGDGGAGTPGSASYGTRAGAHATYDRPGAKGSPGYHWAQGGRVGYNKGGRVGILSIF